jgi:hypothetical protein
MSKIFEVTEEGGGVTEDPVRHSICGKPAIYIELFIYRLVTSLAAKAS